jgi:sigma-B regulation protein RsbU (phosphoserine phosphatase)
MNASNLSQSTLYQVENILLPPQEIPENLATLIENGDFSMNNLENLLKILVGNNNDVFGACVAFEPYAFRPDMEYYAPYCCRSGDSVIYKDLGENSYNYTKWEWYRLPQEKGHCWGEPYFDRGGGNTLMITYSVPFFYKNTGHKFRGVVTADISLDKLKELISNMKVYQTGYTFLLSSAGIIISSPDTNMMENENIFYLTKKNNQPDLAAIAKEMIDGKTGFRMFHSVKLNEECYIFYTSLQSNGWSLALILPEKVILADTYSLFRKILFLGIAGSVIILIIIVFISRNITIPLEKLASATQLIGKGDFDAGLPEIRSKDEIGQLADNFVQMQGHLREYIRNLKEVTAERQKIESALRIANAIQQSMLPKTFPPFPERNDIDIHAALIPALQVGGDLYDYFFVDDDLLAICVGDVSGKGIPASLMMAITRTLFRSRTHKKMNAREIVQDINSDLCMENKKAMFVTFFMGLLDLRTGELEYCNAGHNYPYILRENGKLICMDETHGVPLGIALNRPYGHSKVTFNSNDRLVLFTDGVTEAMNRENELYGEENLENLLTGPCKGLAVKETTSCILDDVAKFTEGAEQSDDITLLVLSFRQNDQNITPQPMLKFKMTIKNNLDELERLNAFLEKTANEWGISRELMFELNMVVEEVVSNIIRHGYKENKVEDEILLEMAFNESEITIRITDHSIEFNPLKVPPPVDLDKPARERKVGGLGVYFIREMLDKVDYLRENDSNILILTKKVSGKKTKSSKLKNK